MSARWAASTAAVSTNAKGSLGSCAIAFSQVRLQLRADGSLEHTRRKQQ